MLSWREKGSAQLVLSKAGPGAAGAIGSRSQGFLHAHGGGAARAAAPLAGRDGLQGQRARLFSSSGGSASGSNVHEARSTGGDGQGESRRNEEWSAVAAMAVALAEAGQLPPSGPLSAAARSAPSASASSLASQ